MSSSVQVAGIFLLIIGIFGTTNCYVSNSARSELPPGYTVFQDINVAYKVYNERVSWANAARRCNEDGGQLAIIDTRQKVSYVAGIKPSPGAYVWVGINRTREGSPWTKISDGSQMNNIPWAPGKPTRGSTNCLTVRGCNRGLSNEDCQTNKVFVCEISLYNQQEILQS